MDRQYTLEWLDLLVNVTLNPRKTEVNAINSQQIETIIKTAGEEIDKLQSFLKGKFLGITRQAEIKLLVRRYHSDLTILLDKAHENDKMAGPDSSELKIACQAVVSCLEELLSFIETYYDRFLGLDERVPVTYLQVTRNELRYRLEQLQTKLFKRTGDRRLSAIVFDTLYNFASGSMHATFRDVLYKKDMVRGLEEIADIRSEDRIYKALNELLIYRNFNKKEYLHYYTGKIAEKINACGPLQEKIDLLRHSQKEFKQMYKKTDVKLNPHYADIKDVIGCWFKEEINYLEKKFHSQVNPLETRSDSNMTSGSNGIKVQLALNADQIAILLRTFVEIGILHMKSLKLVFKSIIPFLSSKRQEDLSWDSMRKRSYSPEDKDRKAVIAILDKAKAYLMSA